MFTLHNGDCLEYMKTLQPASVDCVITDPPYNLGIDYGETTNDKRLDYAEWCAEWLGELERICKGAIAISCGVANIGMWSKIKEPIWMLCWHKSFSVSHGAFGFSNWEPVLIYGKTGKHERQSDYFHATFVKDKTTGTHPCPKPTQWAQQIVKIVSDEGDLVFDPFMGSGTVGKACVKMNRRFIGCEISAEYFAIAEKRVKSAALQPSLFTPSNNRLHPDVGDSPAQQALFTPEADTAEGKLPAPAPRR